MKTNDSSRILVLLSILLAATAANAVTPPVFRSTAYDGEHSNIVHHASQTWMNTNTVLMTVEAWVFANDLDGNQALVARHYTTNLYFGLSGNRLRLYRSGGTSADSDGTLAAGRWTHVAASYDGASARFYINGVLAGTKALAHAGNNCTNGLSLGGQRDILNLGDAFAGGYAFNGYLDEVRLWSVVRSEANIAANIGNELRSGTGLMATFGTGGILNDLSGTLGTTPGISVNERLSGFGLLPSALCIPRTQNLLRVDATIDLLNEYRGAETIVLRSTTSAITRDRPAYLMVSTNATNYHLFVGVPDVEQGSSPQTPTVQVMCDVNPTNGTTAALGDWECSFTQDNFQGGKIFTTNPPLFPTPQWMGWGQSVSNWQGATAGSFEFLQNYEFSIHAEHLNHFTNSVGLLVRYHDFNGTTEQLVAPRGGITNQPATYALANWCGAAVSDLRAVTISGVVSNVTTGANQSGWIVTLLSGPNETSANVIRSQEVSGSGTFTITGNIPKELSFHLRLEARTDYSYLAPEFTGSGSLPANINANRTLTYSACFDTPCISQDVRFRVQSPPGPVSITSLSRSNGAPEVVLRDTPRKVAPGSIVTLFGTNLHTRFEVYLSKCSVSPSFCTEGVDIFRVNILTNDPMRTSLTVQLPEGPPAFNGSMQWVLKDVWTSHPGWTQWVYGPAGFVVDRNLHPYPVLHGFEFENEGDGPSLAEFEAVYRNNIFNPFPPFRDPYYYVIWWPIYYGLGEGFRSGSCHGMAAASRLFERGLLNESAFDVPASGGPSGVHYAAGFPSQAGERPFAPADWTGFDFVQPYRPVDLWAVIREYMMSQYSEESFANTLGQLDFGADLSGNPVAVLNRMRTNPRDSILCFNPGGIGGGHCVTPYGVIDDVALDPSNLFALVPAVNFSVIKVYDNNFPNLERFLEIDRSNNRYRYVLGFRDGDAAQPVIWSSRSIFTAPLSLFTNARHAPGASTFATSDFATFIRYLIGGQADPEHADTSGKTWGWNTAGVFTNTYPGARSIYPLFGFATNRDVRSAVAFLPTTNAPAKTTINVRGSNYVFHAGHKGTTYQLVVSNRVAGGADVAQLLVANEAPTGLRFVPDKPLGTVIPMLGETAPDASIVHILIGLSLLGGHEIEMRSLPDKHGLAFLNRGGAPLNYWLELQAVDANAGMVCSNRYGPFTTPAGAAHHMTFPEWPSTTQVLSGLDFDADGNIDETHWLAAERALFATRDGDQIILRWRSSAQTDTVEMTDSLEPPIKWGKLNGQPEKDGEWKVLKVTATAQQQFYRVMP